MHRANQKGIQKEAQNAKHLQDTAQIAKGKAAIWHKVSLSEH